MVRNYKKKGLRALRSKICQSDKLLMDIKFHDRDHINNKRRKSSEIFVVPEHVGRTVFTEEEENLLKQCCMKLLLQYFGLLFDVI